MKNNLYIIAPEDPTLDFLSPIFSDQDIEPFIGGNLIRVGSSEKGYDDAKTQVLNIPKKSLILFLGHGTSKSLLGGGKSGYRKKVYLESKFNGFI